jgi:hypothetical protein
VRQRTGRSVEVAEKDDLADTERPGIFVMPETGGIFLQLTRDPFTVFYQRLIRTHQTLVGIYTTHVPERGCKVVRRLIKRQRPSAPYDLPQ